MKGAVAPLCELGREVLDIASVLGKGVYALAGSPPGLARGLEHLGNAYHRPAEHADKGPVAYLGLFGPGSGQLGPLDATCCSPARLGQHAHAHVGQRIEGDVNRQARHRIGNLTYHGLGLPLLLDECAGLGSAH